MQKVKIVAQKVKTKYRKITVILQSESNKKNMNIKSIITAAMALLVSTGCSGTKATTNGIINYKRDNNYGKGRKGNTKIEN